MNKEKSAFDEDVAEEMVERVEKFKAAKNTPDKSLTPNPNVKHDAHNVDTQGFQPTARITVDDEEGDEKVIEEHPAVPHTRSS